MYQEAYSDKDTGGNVYEMKYLYVDSFEDIPHNDPNTRLIATQLNCFADSDNDCDSISSMSQTGILLYCNSSPILWYSKYQNTV